MNWDTIFQGVDAPKEWVMFRKPPNVSEYICYYEDVDHTGADYLIGIQTHTVTIEVYSSKGRAVSVSEISKNLSGLFIEHSVAQPTWIKEADMFLTLITFITTTKGGQV